MKKSSIFFAALVSAMVLTNTGCKKDTVTDNNEEELITPVKLMFTPLAGSTSTTFMYKDVDGAGGNAPTIDSIRLTKDTIYNVQMILADDSKSPSQDITSAIQAEKEDHIFIFTAAPTTLFHHIEIKDMDANNKPVGLSTEWHTENAVAMGNVRILLKHKADKNTPATTGGTDLDISFPVKIE